MTELRGQLSFPIRACASHHIAILTSDEDAYDINAGDMLHAIDGEIIDFARKQIVADAQRKTPRDFTRASLEAHEQMMATAYQNAAQLTRVFIGRVKTQRAHKIREHWSVLELDRELPGGVAMRGVRLVVSRAPENKSIEVARRFGKTHATLLTNSKEQTK